jgi:hypothetical protein
MTFFENGPASGQFIDLRRVPMPFFLRVVKTLSTRLKWR